MYQQLFRIPFLDIPIYGYGLMLVIGFLLAIQLGKYLAKQCGLDPEVFVNAGLLALVTGIAGARISHVLENFGYYTNPNRSAWANLWDAINIRSGGLTYYGGFLLAFPSLVLYAKWKKVPIRLGMDIVAPCVMVGLAFGRIGCFLNGCCYGATCELPWAVQFPYYSIPYREEVAEQRITPPEMLSRFGGDGRAVDVLSRPEIAKNAAELPPNALAVADAQHSLPVHPAQLYSALTATLIGLVVVCYFTLPHIPGRAFALMVMIEGLTRYLLELLRVEPPVVGPFSLSMLLGIGLLILGAVLWIAFGLAGGQIAERNDSPMAAIAAA